MVSEATAPDPKGTPVAAPTGAATVRSRKRIGWQAKAPAPQKRKPLRTNVGHTLSSVNPAISATFCSFLGSVS